MIDRDKLQKLIDEFNQELCWAGCGVKCETREERRRLEAKVKDKYAQAIAEMFDERITGLESLLKDVWAVYGEKAESSFHPAWEVDGELAERMKELGIEGNYER